MKHRPTKNKKSKRNIKPEYKDLSRFLKARGLNSYYDYLKSKLWYKIRRKVLDKYPLCYCCRRTATQVHHKSYTWKNLSGDSMNGLIALCEHCHDHIEMTEKRKKVDLATANSRLVELKKSGIMPMKPNSLEDEFIGSPAYLNLLTWSHIK
jgi:hypothetical protein